MSQARVPEIQPKDKNEQKIVSNISDLTREMIAVLKDDSLVEDSVEKTFKKDSEKLQKAKFLIETSLRYKNSNYPALTIDFDNYVDSMVAYSGTQHYVEPMTLLELASRIDNSCELLELIFSYSTYFSPNCLWLATGRRQGQRIDSVDFLLSTGKFNPNQPCLYQKPNEINYGYPLQIACNMQLVPSVFALLACNADPATVENQALKANADILSLVQTAAHLKNANEQYKSNKFEGSGSLTINADFTAALKLNPDFVITYLTKSVEALMCESDGRTPLPRYPELPLVKHYLKLVYETIKSCPDLINSLELKEKLHDLCTELVTTISQEARDNNAIISTGPCLFATQHKKEKMLKCFGYVLNNNWSLSLDLKSDNAPKPSKA